MITSVPSERPASPGGRSSLPNGGRKPPPVSDKLPGTPSDTTPTTTPREQAAPSRPPPQVPRGAPPVAPTGTNNNNNPPTSKASPPIVPTRSSPATSPPVSPSKVIPPSGPPPRTRSNPTSNNNQPQSPTVRPLGDVAPKSIYDMNPNAPPSIYDAPPTAANTGQKQPPQSPSARPNAPSIYTGAAPTRSSPATSPPVSPSKVIPPSGPPPRTRSNLTINTQPQSPKVRAASPPSPARPPVNNNVVEEIVKEESNVPPLAPQPQTNPSVRSSPMVPPQSSATQPPLQSNTAPVVPPQTSAPQSTTSSVPPPVSNRPPVVPPPQSPAAPPQSSTPSGPKSLVSTPRLPPTHNPPLPPAGADDQDKVVMLSPVGNHPMPKKDAQDGPSSVAPPLSLNEESHALSQPTASKNISRPSSRRGSGSAAVMPSMLPAEGTRPPPRAAPSSNTNQPPDARSGTTSRRISFDQQQSQQQQQPAAAVAPRNSGTTSQPPPATNTTSQPHPNITNRPPPATTNAAASLGDSYSPSPIRKQPPTSSPVRTQVNSHPTAAHQQEDVFLSPVAASSSHNHYQDRAVHATPVSQHIRASSSQQSPISSPMAIVPLNDAVDTPKGPGSNKPRYDSIQKLTTKPSNLQRTGDTTLPRPASRYDSTQDVRKAEVHQRRSTLVGSRDNAQNSSTAPSRQASDLYSNYIDFGSLNVVNTRSFAGSPLAMSNRRNESPAFVVLEPNTATNNDNNNMGSGSVSFAAGSQHQQQPNDLTSAMSGSNLHRIVKEKGTKVSNSAVTSEGELANADRRRPPRPKSPSASLRKSGSQHFNSSSVSGGGRNWPSGSAFEADMTSVDQDGAAPKATLQRSLSKVQAKRQYNDDRFESGRRPRAGGPATAGNTSEAHTTNTTTATSGAANYTSFHRQDLTANITPTRNVAAPTRQEFSSFLNRREDTLDAGRPTHNSMPPMHRSTSPEASPPGRYHSQDPPGMQYEEGYIHTADTMPSSQGVHAYAERLHRMKSSSGGRSDPTQPSASPTQHRVQHHHQRFQESEDDEEGGVDANAEDVPPISHDGDDVHSIPDYDPPTNHMVVGNRMEPHQHQQPMMAPTRNVDIGASPPNTKSYDAPPPTRTVVAEEQYEYTRSSRQHHNTRGPRGGFRSPPDKVLPSYQPPPPPQRNYQQPPPQHQQQQAHIDDQYYYEQESQQRPRQQSPPPHIQQQMSPESYTIHHPHSPLPPHLRRGVKETSHIVRPSALPPNYVDPMLIIGSAPRRRDDDVPTSPFSPDRSYSQHYLRADSPKSRWRDTGANAVEALRLMYTDRVREESVSPRGHSPYEDRQGPPPPSMNHQSSRSRRRTSIGGTAPSAASTSLGRTFLTPPVTRVHIDNTGHPVVRTYEGSNTSSRSATPTDIRPPEVRFPRRR